MGYVVGGVVIGLVAAGAYLVYKGLEKLEEKKKKVEEDESGT